MEKSCVETNIAFLPLRFDDDDFDTMYTRDRKERRD